MIGESSNPSVVFVTHAFPPGGGSGVQRIVKFAKYLPDMGVHPSVITIKNTLKKTSDASLLDEVSGLKIIRSFSLDPMFIADMFKSDSKKGTPGNGKGAVATKVKGVLFRLALKIRDYCRLPDQYIGWIPFAFIPGVKHIKSQNNPIILASLPTYTNGLLGFFLSRATGAPLVLDFRDSWTDDPYLILPTKFHRWVHSKLEKMVLGHAKHFVVYADWLKEVYETRYPAIPVTVILNGYDSSDFPINAHRDLKRGKIRLAYSGSLFEYHEEFIEMLFSTVSSLSLSSNVQLEMVFAGDIQLTNFDALVEKYRLNSIVVKLGYVKHVDVLSLLLSSDGLLFTVPKGDTLSYTGKIFEYLGARKPIISFASPEGPAGKLLREFGHGDWLVDYDMDHASKIFSKLDQLEFIDVHLDADLNAKIERKGQAGALAEVLKNVAKS
jgi:hypothetical protein